MPAHLILDNGLRIVQGHNYLPTNIRLQTADLDVSASYPLGGASLNISKETTKKELCFIEGIEESVRRAQGLNLSAGHTNAVEICTELFKLPQLNTLLESFLEDLETS